METRQRAIPSHKTAIHRGDLSRPMKRALQDGLIGPAVSVFDYGCGHGHDVDFLQGQGIACTGWDPVFRPGPPRCPADVVNLGYVLNVIEDSGERAATLRQAWQLCRNLLVVAAQVDVAGRGQQRVEFGDGILTPLGTFQKFYRQDELKEYLEGVLGAEADAAELGIFYVFKDEALRQQFLANRFRRRSAGPRPRLAELRFQEHREVLEPFMAAVADLGRLPDPEEYPAVGEIVERCGAPRTCSSTWRSPASASGPCCRSCPALSSATCGPSSPPTRKPAGWPTKSSSAPATPPPSMKPAGAPRSASCSRTALASAPSSPRRSPTSSSTSAKTSSRWWTKKTHLRRGRTITTKASGGRQPPVPSQQGADAPRSPKSFLDGSLVFRLLHARPV
jgi:hypothetical protein